MIKKIIPFIVITLVVMSGCSGGASSDNTNSTNSTNSTTDTTSDEQNRVNMRQEEAVSGPHASAESVVNEYYVRLESDPQGVMELLVPSMQGNEFVQEFIDFASELGLKFSKHKIISVEGNTVRVEVTAEFEGETEDSIDVFEVEEIDGTWYLVNLPDEE